MLEVIMWILISLETSHRVLRQFGISGFDFALFYFLTRFVVINFGFA